MLSETVRQHNVSMMMVIYVESKKYNKLADTKKQQTHRYKMNKLGKKGYQSEYVGGHLGVERVEQLLGGIRLPGCGLYNVGKIIS